MKGLDAIIGVFDRLQQRWRLAAIGYAVVKKFGDDQAGQMVVALGWYGFTAIFPLLLVVVTILGFIGTPALGTTVVSTLHQFPVIGPDFNPAHGSKNLHGSLFGLVAGLLVLLYGAQGVTETAQAAMATVWNVPAGFRPRFVGRLGRSVAALGLIGSCFVANAALGALATADREGGFVRALVGAAMVVADVVLYTATFRVLTPRPVRTRDLVPGAVVGAVGFTVLTTVGAGLVEHQIRNSSNTYGQFGLVIGLVGYLLLLARLSLYGAELNPVLAHRLWPRSLRPGQEPEPSEADLTPSDKLS